MLPGLTRLPPPPAPVVLLPELSLEEASEEVLASRPSFGQLLSALLLPLLVLASFSALALRFALDFFGANRSNALGTLGGSVHSRRVAGANPERRTHAAPADSRVSARMCNQPRRGKRAPSG